MMRSATGMDTAGLGRLMHAIEHAKDYSTEARAQAVKEGAAMPGGRYPIYNATDLRNAVDDYNRTGQPPAVKEHIVKRAKALNLPSPFDNDEDD